MRMLPVLLVVFVLGGCDQFGSKSEKEYLEQATVALEEGSPKEALIALKNVLAKNPENGYARLLLGNVYTDAGEVVAAESEFRKALDLQVSPDALLPALAEVLLAQGKIQDLQILAPKKLETPAARAALLSTQGLGWLSQGDSEKAGRHFDDALKLVPGLTRALVGKAGVAASQKDLSAAYGYIELALRADPESAFAWSYYADLKRFEGKFQEAVDGYSKAIGRRKANWSERLKRALLNIQLQKLSEADKDIQLLKQQWKGSSKVLYAEGLLHLHRKQYAKAQEALELALKANPQSYQVAYVLGVVHLHNGNLGQAEDHANVALARDRHFSPALKLLMAVRYREGDFGGAEQLAAQVLEQQEGDKDAMNVLAASLMNQGRFNEAIPVYEKIAALDSDSYQARMQLGVGRLKQGDTEGGEEALVSAISLAPERSEADVALVLGLMKAEAHDRALQVALDFVRRRPREAVAYNLLGLTRTALKELDIAKLAFNKARELEPGDPTACTNLAQHALAVGDFQKAQGYYREILSKHPRHLSSLLNAASVEARLGDRGQAIALLERAVQVNPTLVRPKVLLAREYLAVRRAPQALNLFGSMLESHANNPVVLTVIGEIYLAVSRLEDAHTVLRRAVGIVPDNPQAQFLLARATAAIGDPKGTEAALRQTLRLVPTHVRSRIALAKLLVTQGRYGEAKVELAAARKTVDANAPDVLEVEAVLLAAEGRPAEANTTFEHIFQIKRDTASLISMARAQWMLDARERSMQVLQQWVQEHPDDQAARMELADRLLRVGQEAKAVALYKETLAQNEKNVVALNNLAWFYRDADPRAALQYAQRAFDLAPRMVAVVDTLVVSLINVGELEKAERVLERSDSGVADSSTLRYRKAVLLEKLGRQADARALLVNLLSTETPFAEQDDARQLLQRLVVE